MTLYSQVAMAIEKLRNAEELTLRERRVQLANLRGEIETALEAIRAEEMQALSAKLLKIEKRWDRRKK